MGADIRARFFALLNELAWNEEMKWMGDFGYFGRKKEDVLLFTDHRLDPGKNTAVSADFCCKLKVFLL